MDKVKIERFLSGACFVTGIIIVGMVTYVLIGNTFFPPELTTYIQDIPPQIIGVS